MATTNFILGIICLAGTFGNRLPHRHLLSNRTTADQIIHIAQTQIGVRENGGNNRGQQVKHYLAYVNIKQPAPWCAAFVSWVYGQAGYAQPKTAWSPALFPSGKLTNIPNNAAIFGIYFSNLKRIAHCGLVEKTQGNWIISIEGNTNIAGSNDGDGVYRKWRHQKTIAVFAHWLPEKGAEHE